MSFPATSQALSAAFTLSVNAAMHFIIHAEKEQRHENHEDEDEDEGTIR